MTKLKQTPQDPAASPRRLLVAGCGDVGSVLARERRARGWEVWGLRRQAEKLPAGIRPLAADLGDPATLRDLPAGLTDVVYTAAASGFDDEAYRRAYVEGVENLLAALDEGLTAKDGVAGDGAEAPLERLLFVSSTGVYGVEDGSWVDETSPTEPASFSGRRLLEGEALILADDGPAARLARHRAVVRLGGIYGPGRTRLIDSVRDGTARCSPETVWTNRIHRDDCAGVLAHLLDLPGEELEPVWIGVDEEPAERCTVLRWIAGRLGAPEPPVDPEASRRRRGNKRCSSRRLMDSGYRFLFPTWRQGYGALLAREAPEN